MASEETPAFGGSAGSEKPVSRSADVARQTRPKQVEAHYPVARMTYLTISTEDLAALAMSSGIGSLALSALIYFYKAAPSETASVGFAFTLAITLTAYVFFGGLVIRIRRRSKLRWWNLFGE